MCGWANLRSHLAIPFNQNQYPVCGLIMTGDLPEWEKERKHQVKSLIKLYHKKEKREKPYH